MATFAVFQIICLICLSLFVSTNFCIEVNPSEETIVTTSKSLPFDLSLVNSFQTNCKQKTVSSQKEILIISTLDGKLSALDVESGEQIWSKVFTSEPLLSSTISNFEITRKGRIVRVVPSLDGNLYLFNGKTIDGIPLNADILLKSSFKLGDDLVVTGGQESKISGIDISTGKVYYECGLKGCPSSQLNENETFDDLFLLKSITQTVRAIDPRNGRQKWFFSVTEPQITKTFFSECQESTDFDKQNDEINSESSSSPTKETDFNIIVPNGFISVERYLSDKSESSRWSYRFESPIVHVWHYRSGQIDSIDLFDKRKLFGLSNTDLNLKGFEPTVYIGLYRNQWYVQSSDAIKEQMIEKNNNLMASTVNKQIDSKPNVLQIEWKPKAVHFEKDSENALGLESIPKFSLSISSDEEESVGFYIFDAIEDNETKCFGDTEENQSHWEYEEESDLIQQIVIASLWHYWREVTAISIISAFALNFIYSYLKRKLRDSCNDSDNPSNNQSKSKSGERAATPSFSLPFESNGLIENNSFNSRYESDFQPIQLLGKGGFGLVFEAKHIIDESHYAVKRISLPIRKERREKVMREVRALSKLEHPGIVRYYNAWVELPPPGWQENRDKQWNNEETSKSLFEESDHKSLTSYQSKESLKSSDRPKILITEGIPRCYLYIQMQLCRKDTLKDWLFANSLNRETNKVLDIFDQIVNAVHYVHSMGLMHRDLKPTNIFFSMDGNIKIGDFGLVTATAIEEESHTPGSNEFEDEDMSPILKRGSSSHTNRVGTQLYMSPEQVQNKPYSHKVDIFSMGIILFELLVPFKTEMERTRLLNEARKQKFPPDFCFQFIPECDLLKKLLAHNPDERPTTLEIKEHEMLKKLQSTSPVVRQRSRTLSSTNDSFISIE